MRQRPKLPSDTSKKQARRRPASSREGRHSSSNPLTCAARNRCLSRRSRASWSAADRNLAMTSYPTICASPEASSPSLPTGETKARDTTRQDVAPCPHAPKRKTAARPSTKLIMTRFFATPTAHLPCSCSKRLASERDASTPTSHSRTSLHPNVQSNNDCLASQPVRHGFRFQMPKDETAPCNYPATTPCYAARSALPAITPRYAPGTPAVRKRRRTHAGAAATTAAYAPDRMAERTSRGNRPTGSLGRELQATAEAEVGHRTGRTTRGRGHPCGGRDASATPGSQAPKGAGWSTASAR